MNKILVLAEKKQYGEVFCGIFGPAGFYRCTFTAGPDVQVDEDDDIIIVHPGDGRSSLKGAIEKARKQQSGIRAICISEKYNSPFKKQFRKRDIDAFFTMRTTLGEIDEATKRFLFPERYREARSEDLATPESVSLK